MMFFACLLLISVGEVFSIKWVLLNRMNQTLQVRTLNGVMQGREEDAMLGGRYFSYQGIPYAKPPVNQLRFRSPKLPANWTGVLDATNPASCCKGLDMQAVSKLRFDLTGEEDCLYLNVYVPLRNDGNSANLPVMVFFHGGAFVSGCSYEYGPDYLMQNRQVVLVTSNYRLGAFGFLSTQDQECPGNIASKDNLAVLKWIQTNIRYFGGDPTKVTIFGESAGATLVSTILLSPKSKGLFQRAILMSGSSLPFWSYQTEQRRIAFDLGLALGIETRSSKVLLDKLRNMGSEELSKAQIVVGLLNLLLVLTNGLPFTPTVEPHHQGALLTDYAYSLFEKGKFNKVPVLIGVTSLEAAPFRILIAKLRPLLFLFDLSPGSFVRLTKSFQKRRIVGKKIASRFLRRKEFAGANEKELIQLLSDEAFWRPIRKTASLLAKHVPVYFYEFSYEGEIGRKLLETYTGEQEAIHGVGHGVDLSYLFPFKALKGTVPNRADRRLISKLCKIFTNFAKTGNPTPSPDVLLENITWPEITQHIFPYVNLNESFTVSTKSFKEDNFQFWTSLFESFAEKPYKVY